jgi:hypothetical protein
MQPKMAEVTAEEWAKRKLYSEEFFHACLVDEDAAILVHAAEMAGDISIATAIQLWNEIAAGIRYHQLRRC